MGCGLLRLTPAEVHDLTFFEIDLMLEGWEERRKQRLWEASYFTAHLMNIHLKEKNQVQPSDLMKVFLPKQTAEEIKAERNRIMKEFGITKKGGK